MFDLTVADKLKKTLPPGPLQLVFAKEGTECFQASMIADLADIHVNNKIGMPSYSYVNTSSDQRNSSGNGIRFPSQSNQELMNQVKSRPSDTKGNSPPRDFNDNNDLGMPSYRQLDFGHQ